MVGGLVIACGPSVQSPTEDTTGTSTTDSTSMTSSPSTSDTSPTTTAETSTMDPDTTNASDDVMRSDLNHAPDIGGKTCGDECGAIDVLFVVDNTGTMAPSQLALTRAAVRWIGEVLGDGAEYDVQIMVTTTDMGNPLCTPFQPAGYEPAAGAPTQTGCNARIDHFTGLGADPVVADWACTSTCPNDVVPDDPFIAFGPLGANIPDVPELDIDADAVPDSAIAQSLACMLPQGINGCGYEEPLEAMLMALNPGAPWNSGDRPFLRDDARLAIVLVTDEADCSVDDYSLMSDEAYFNDNPDTGMPQPTSALCWNAGVECSGPDGAGVYSDCMSVVDGPLHEVDRYIGYLRDDLVVGQGKSIDFFSIGGVPEVTEYDAQVPYAPTAGGLLDLVVRNWEDGAYPAGDIVPADAADGLDAADKHFTFGIGPACTGENAADGFTQALPNPRLVEVCLALDGVDDQHCFVDSICAPTYNGIFGTLWGTMRAPMGD